MSVPTMGVVSVVVVLMAASTHVGAQQLMCYAVRPGDTAAGLAQRLTGHAGNRQKPWFRIVDPGASRVISKAHYETIRPGWLACIATAPVRHPAPVNSEPTISVPRPDLITQLGAMDFDLVGWGAAFCFAMTLLVWSRVKRRSRARRKALNRMQRFGEMFIREFERPLVRDGALGRPIRSRLRCMPHRERLDILLAPDGGRHYPNLSDHRRNVEYDVERITRCLRDEMFIGGPIYARGAWVVIPFQLKAKAKMEGAL